MTQICDQCGRPFEPKRPHQIYDDRECRYQGWIQREVEAAQEPVQRVETGVGGRGGNVRSVQEARDLQSQQKDKRDWAGAIDEQIRRTLIETGYFHADDLDALGVPPEHCNLKGTRAAWFRNQKLMESTDVYRKVSHAAANGRKAPIYRISAKGRAKLVGMGGAASQPSPHSGEKPSEISAGVPNPGGAHLPPVSTGDSSDGCVSGATYPPAPDTPADQLPGLGDPPSAFNPYSEAA